MPKSASDHLSNDADREKGSREPDEPNQPANNSMRGQLSHRDNNPLVEGADSDFPEPGFSPEHSFEGKLKKK
ncbi:MAG TPA: hypothetical protein VMT67_04000 [Terriglobales bacterium]|nr:hypothetical protein [Terriglobales bacterium]